MTHHESSKLKQALSDRQVTMITIGGIVGAGLFIASASAINTIGPAVLISYIIVGILVFLVMRMLGEMAILSPDTGSFSVYADRSLGHWAGFTIGWLYWWYWMLVTAFEAVMGAGIVAVYFPDIPSYMVASAIILFLALTNLFDVRNFGEFEFWFALIKVVAVLTFIIICTLAIFGFWPLNPEISGIGNLYQNGGFLPEGVSSIFSGIIIVMFSFFGVEMLSIAAAEAKQPKKQIRRSTNLVIYRLAFFYIISIFLVLCIVPWSDPGLQKMGTFQYVLFVLNVPSIRLIMDIVVFVAVCSILNTGTYICSRMLFSLSSRGDAPKIFSKISTRRTPRLAVIVTTIFSLCFVGLNYFISEGLFFFFLSTLGAISLLVYLIISCSQLKMRKDLDKKGVKLDFKMWCFPYLTYFVILLIIATLGYMFLNDQYQYETLVTLGLTSIILIASFIVNHKKVKNHNIQVESE